MPDTPVDLVEIDEWLTALEELAVVATDVETALDALDDLEAHAVILARLDAALDLLTLLRSELARNLGRAMKVADVDVIATPYGLVLRDRKPSRRTDWLNDALARDVRLKLFAQVAVTEEGEPKPVTFDDVWSAVTDLLPIRGYNLAVGKIRALGLDPDDYAHTEAGYSIAKIEHP